MPQVYGVVKETSAFVRYAIEAGFNTFTNNSLVTSREEKVCSEGNFNGGVIFQAMDILALALAGSVLTCVQKLLGEGQERRSWYASDDESPYEREHTMTHGQE